MKIIITVKWTVQVSVQIVFISPLDAELEYLGFFIPKASFKYSGVLVIEMLVCVTL